MEKILGTNLGNWLVLEKWMSPELFEGTGAEDETWLARKLSPDALSDKLKQHRETYVTEEDFRFIAECGLNTVRLPVPYFLFGDRPPFVGCAEYVDCALDWAEKYGIRVLIDLHTVPYSQNGYDNGGITGVCKWCKYPEEVEFALTVLERIAQRWGNRKGLFGIEVLNEPISLIVYLTAPSTGKAVDKEEAKGSGHVPTSFLRSFYKEAYRRIRAFLPEEKAVVFHDGFRLTAWNRYFRESGFKNVILDTHIYIFAMENFVPIAKPWVYRFYIFCNSVMLRHVEKSVPVVVGEWCLCNKYADRAGKLSLTKDEKEAEQKRRFREIAKLELNAWNRTSGWFYWNYQLLRDSSKPTDESWKESWDLSRCIRRGWLTRADISESP